MKTFSVRLTRDCRFTQSVDIEVQAESKKDAETKACNLSYGKIDEMPGGQWEDDDGSYYFGETGTYIGDPDEITEVVCHT